MRNDIIQVRESISVQDNEIKEGDLENKVRIEKVNDDMTHFC